MHLNMPVPFTTGYSTFEEINSPTKHYTNHTELQEKDKRRWRLLIPTCLWFPPASPRAAPVLLPRSPSASRSRSGTPSLSGLGTSLSITVLSAGTTSWISASSAKPTRLAPLARNALWLGEFVTMLFTSIASVDGSRLVKFVL